MRIYKLLLLLPVFLIAQEIEANHVLGGNVTWDCLGSNQYQVTLTMYKDCFGASTALSAENVFFFPNGCGAFPFNASLSLISTTEISDLCPSELANSSCVGGLAPGTQKLVYRGTVTLDPNCTWKVIWNEGDWNYFNNINYATLPDAYICATINTAYCVDSPVITSMQVPYECRNNGNITHTPTVTIPAGVTATYSLTSPQTTGASINSSIGVPGYTNPLGATVNAATGAVTINTVGQTVGTYLVTIQITLTQGGNVIGTLYENMTFVIRDCASTPTTFDSPEIQSIQNPSQLANPTTINACAGDSICFTVSASNSNIQRNITITASWPAGLNAGNPVFIQSTATTNPGVGEFCMATSSATIGTGFLVNFHAVDDACLLPSSDDMDITLNIYPSIQLTPTTATICANTPVNAVASGGATYSWNVLSGDNTPGFDGNNANQTLESISSNTVITATIPGVPAQCDATDTLTVFVTSISTQPISSQSICVGGSSTALSVAITNADPLGVVSYQWYSNSVNSTSGGTAVSGATNATYTPPATSAGTTYYYCIVSITGGGCPSITSNVSEVIVLADPTITTQPTASQSICAGGTPSALNLVYANGTGTATYQWYSNTSNSNSGGTAIAGATAATYNPATINTAGTYYYYGITTLSGSGCGSVASAVATVTVLADPTITTQPASSQTICAGGTASPFSVVAAGGTGTFSYQWYSNTTNNNSGGTAITGATSASYSPTNSTIGTYYYYCIISQTGNGCGNVTSTVSTLNVVASPTVSTQPTVTQTICSGGTPTAISVATSGGTGTPTYQWYSNNSNSAVGGTAITGATNSNFSPTSVAVGTVYYYATITLSGSGCSAVTSATSAVVTVADPTISTQPQATQLVCVGGAPNALSAAAINGTGNQTFQWFSNTVNSNSGGTAIAGATNSTYSPPVLNTVGNYFYYVVISYAGSGCQPATSNASQVSCVTDPNINLQPLVTQTICQNAPATIISTSYSGGTGTASYQWYSNTTNSTTGGTIAAGGTSSSFNPPTTTVGTVYYYCVVTLTGTGCNTATSNTSTVIVTQGPTVTTQPTVTQTICAGGTVSPLSVAYGNGTGTPSYQWYSNTTNSTTGGTLIPGATNTSFTPTATVAGTTYYYCQISFTGGGCSSILSNTATVVSVALPTITTQPTANQTICVGGTPSSISLAYSNGTGTATYQWYSNTVNSTTGGTAITGATATNYAPPVLNTAGTYYYYGVATLSGSGCGTATTSVSQVTVVADPTISTQILASQTVCQNGLATPLTPVITGGTGTLSYAWFTNLTNSTVGGIPSGSAATLNPITAVVGTAYVYCVITQTGSGCGTLTTIASQVTVVAVPTISTQPTANQTLCVNGVPTNLTVAYTNGTGTPSYQWYSNAVSSNVGGSIIAGATNATYTPPTTAAGTFNYYCIVSLSGAGCGTVTSAPAEVIVNALPTISTQPISGGTICVGGLPNAFSIAYTGGAGSPTYQWFSNTTNSNNGGAAIVGATSNTFSPPALNTVGNYFYYATVTLNGPGCGSVSSSTTQVTVVDDPTINVQPLASNSVCEGATIPALTLVTANGTGTASYQWYSNALNSNSGGNAILNETNPTYVPPATTVGSNYYYCTVNFNGAGCNAVTTAAAEVIVVAQPTISTEAIATQTICTGGIPAALSPVYSNGTGTPTYQWYSNVTNSTAGGTAIAGETDSTYTPNSNTVGSQFYYLTISLSGSNCAAVTTATSEIIVVADPTISTQPLAVDSMCVGGTPNPLQTAVADGTGAISYQWFSNVAPQNTGGTPIVGETNANFTPITSNTPGDFFYYVVATFNGLGCDAVTSSVATNTFVSDPSIATQPLVTQTLCVNGATTDLTFTYSDGFGNPSIEWFSNTTNSTLGGTSLTEVSNTLTPSNTPDGTTYYFATLTLDGNGCDAINTDISEVIVNALPTISIVALNDSICFGQSTDLTASGAQDYQWTADPTITTADNLNVITVSPVGSVNYIVTGTDAIGCTNTNSFTVFAADELIVAENNVTTVCFSTCTGEIDLVPTGGVSNYQVTWSDPNLVGLTLIDLCPATYDYTLTDAIGCAFSNSIVITELQDNPIDNAILTQPVCFQDANGTIEIQDANAVEYTLFDATSGVEIGGQAIGTFNNLSAGTFNIQITDALGCVFDSLNLVLTEQSAEIILNVDAQPNLFCFGQLVPLTATASGGDNNLTITWADCNNIPACALGTGSPFDYTINQDVTLYAQAIDGLGCLGAIESVALDMSDAISLQIQNGTLSEEICEGECVNMTAAVSGGNNNLTIQWYEIGTPVGGATIGPDGLANMICPPASTGVYVYADDGCNAPASDTLLITVFEVPDVTFTVSAQEGCYPVTVQFNNTTDPNLIGNCIWTMGDGTTIADCSPQTYTYEEVGSYVPSLYVMSPDGCSSATSLAAPINVWDYPVADFAWTPDPVNVLETEVQFSNLSTGADTYDWSFATFGTSSEPNPIWTFPDVDLAVYPVCLEATNIHGCSNSICYEILIESILQIWVPNAFTPDNDGKNDVFLPVINGANPENYHFAIYDRWGTLMFETNELGEAWIGNIRGGEYYPKSDSFVWRIEVEHLSDRRLEVLEGTVTLLR